MQKLKIKQFNQIITSVILLILISGSISSAQDWKAIEFPYAGKLTGVHFTHPDTGFVITDEGEIYRTFNAGGFWETFEISYGVPLEDLHFINSDTGFVCGQAGKLYFTHDGGYNWTNSSLQDSNVWLFDIEMIDNQHIVTIGMGRDVQEKMTGIALRTDDGGKTWKKIKQMGVGYSEIYSASDTISFLSYGRIHISVDKGKTWTTRKTHNGEPARTITKFNNAAIIAGPGGNVYYSTDGGVTWEPSTQQSFKVFVASQLVSETEAYLGGINTDLIKSTDGGKSWNTEPAPLSFSIFDFCLIENRIYAVGSDGSVISKDIK